MCQQHEADVKSGRRQRSAAGRSGPEVLQYRPLAAEHQVVDGLGTHHTDADPHGWPEVNHVEIREEQES